MFGDWPKYLENFEAIDSRVDDLSESGRVRRESTSTDPPGLPPFSGVPGCVAGRHNRFPAVLRGEFRPTRHIAASYGKLLRLNENRLSKQEAVPYAESFRSCVERQQRFVCFLGNQLEVSRPSRSRMRAGCHAQQRKSCPAAARGQSR